MKVRKARKLKIYVKTGKFSFPIPALRFSTLRWITKMAVRWVPKSGECEKNQRDKYLKKLTVKDVDRIIDHLEQINFEEIIEAVKNGAEGKIVDVEDEETQTKVEVYVE